MTNSIANEWMTRAWPGLNRIAGVRRVEDPQRAARSVGLEAPR